MIYARLIQMAACLAAAFASATAQSATLLATNFFPLANATGVCADVPLKITFDGAPAVGTNGAVKIYHSNGTLVDTVNLALSAADGTQPRTVGGAAYNAYPALVSGNTATVFPHAGVLAYSTTYYVTVDAGVFPGYAGVSGSTAWRFTTRASPSSSATSFIVSAGGGGDFCTVQGALDFLPAGNTARRTINVRSGTYQEIVRVSSKHNLAFRGQSRKRTVIAYPNNSTINPNTSTRPVFNVVANDVSFDGLTLSNTTPDGGSQAEALRVNGQRCVVANCDLHSYQDTFLVNSATDSAYFLNSLIEGDADFIWGSGRAVFQSCEIKSLSGGYLCMARNPAGQWGAVFLDCRLTRAPGVTGVYLARIDPCVYTNSAAAFVNCAMDAHIASAGWLLTAGGPTNDLRFWEYQSTDLSGAALNVGGRAAFSAQISAAQAGALRDLSATFGGWKPVPPLPAFPGAEGAGANALGGRGGDVYTVTTLADSGIGSLRDAINTAPATGRTVLFKVSGTIALNANLILNKPRMTIAGQSAPGEGICLKNYSLRISADDVVVRHIRSRLGTDAMREDDSMTVLGGINVMLDHCSASWSVDEVLSITGPTDNATVQWCYVSEALDNSIHSKGPHGFGSIIASYLPASISFHHNLYAHNESRNPRPGNYADSAISLDFRNNVIYDWGYFIGYDSGEMVDLNYVGNYLVKGPGSSSVTAFQSGGTATRIFQSGNKIDLNKNGAFDGADTGWGMFGGAYTPQSAAFDVAPSQNTESAERALQRIISQVGAFPWERDSKDRAVAMDVLYGTGGFVDSTGEAGGYPVLASAPARVDSDGDGMPDFWESAVPTP
jgi:pectate lyase